LTDYIKIIGSLRAVAIHFKTRAWWILLVYVFCILSTLYVMPAVWENFSVNLVKTAVSLLPLFLTTVFFTGFFIYVLYDKKRRLLLSFWLFFFFSVYFFLMKRFELPAERLHFLEYGLLAFLAYKALEKDIIQKKLLYTLTLFLVTGVSLLDEGIQYLLPNRVGELRDVALNVVSGVMGLIITLVIIRSEKAVT
jgi:hypothetical protein